MAKSERDKGTKIVERVITETVEVDEIVLRLSDYEAEVLISILNYVGGSPEFSPRGVSGNILKALEKQTGELQGVIGDSVFDVRKTALYFKEMTEDEFREIFNRARRLSRTTY